MNTYSKLFIVVLFAFVWPCTANSEARVSEVEANLDALFSEVYQDDKPGANVLVAKGEQILLHRAYGLADVELNVALDTDMHFRIASQTKQFTALAMLKLQQQGELQVERPLTAYYPSYPAGHPEVTVEQLATNRSGIPDYVFFEGFLGEDDMKARSLDQLIAYLSDKPFEFAPNQQQSYSSSNFVILGKLIEIVSGKAYESYLQEAFFTPLNMDSTALGRHDKIMPGRVQGYEMEGEELVNAPYLSMSNPHAAGALRSTTMDLYRWQQGLLNGEVIAPALLAQAWSRYELADGYDSSYGYGWFIGNLDGEKTVAHGGRINGFESYAAIVPSQDLHVIILSNNPAASDTSLTHLAGKAIQTALDKPLKPKQQSVTAAQLERMPGQYDFGDWSCTIERQGQQLLMSFPWSEEKEPLYYRDENSIYFADTWSTFTLLEENNYRGDMVMERWDGVRHFGNKE